MMDLEPEEYFRNPKISAHVLKEKKNVFPTKQKNNVETNPNEMANPQRCAVQKKCVLDFFWCVVFPSNRRYDHQMKAPRSNHGNITGRSRGKMFGIADRIDDV
jgi:hypothetical protein